MPIYEYNCQDCKSKFEVFVQRLSEKIVCTNCGSKNIEKLFSSFATGGSSKSETSRGDGCSCGSCS